MSLGNSNRVLCSAHDVFQLLCFNNLGGYGSTETVGIGPVSGSRSGDLPITTLDQVPDAMKYYGSSGVTNVGYDLNVNVPVGRGLKATPFIGYTKTINHTWLWRF